VLITTLPPRLNLDTCYGTPTARLLSTTNPSGMPITYQNRMSSSLFQQDWNLTDWGFPQRCASPPSDTTYTCPISDLSQQLSAHSLEPRPPPREFTASPCQVGDSEHKLPQHHHASNASSFDTTSCHSSSAVFEPELPSELPAYLECTSANIRRQRQRTVREQCSVSHLEAISALVSRMIDNKDQCDVSSSSTGSVDEEDSPISHARSRSDSQASAISSRTSSIASSAPGRRSMENRIRKSGRPRSGAFSLSKRL